MIDQGDGERAKVEMTVEPTLDGGWGLHLVDQVAIRWGVHEGSTHVWFEIGPRPPRALKPWSDPYQISDSKDIRYVRSFRAVRPPDAPSRPAGWSAPPPPCRPTRRT